ncbi:heat shock protein DnaJ domain protein [Alkaliphilus metalliredigens QYMF]|uniref:Heat shock protein DnaJ domain protein n=1 Tax=Alkaliphilus metalliredigens (strain QYMF) TaxID=293826 RepID=A6TKG2_ALKMQ|nr:DnaJ domain-containing protein [Alkaliphilus metalliredigens]ABR46680.1 heat shock protein DnaJ domain protein [Alkaliphilus metalliredigens QYMF]
MRVMKKIVGKVIYAIAKALSAILDSLIQLIETMVLLARSFSKGCLALMSMGGCLFFLFFVFPIGSRILRNPTALLAILFILVFPILGALLVSYLKYLKYITTAYLFNLGNYLMDGVNYQYKAFSEYKVAYRKAEEDRKRKEQNRHYEQQREWEERLRQWRQQNAQREQGSYGGQGNYGHSYANPIVEFKKKYEKCCDVLGVSYDADKYQIKLAYRRKAKQYHPDVNKAADATKMFQGISEAYEFLNDDNIQRYKSV